MSVKFKVKGLRELERNLGKIDNVYKRRAIARKALKEAGEPMAKMARAMAPDDPATHKNDLRRSIYVTDKLNKRQKRYNRPGRYRVEMHVGTNDRAGVLQEYGTINHPPQSFMRPAWEGTRRGMVATIKSVLWRELKARL